HRFRRCLSPEQKTRRPLCRPVWARACVSGWDCRIALSSIESAWAVGHNQQRLPVSMRCSYARALVQECSHASFDNQDDWKQKAEGDDAIANLAFLRVRVCARVTRLRFSYSDHKSFSWRYRGQACARPALVTDHGSGAQAFTDRSIP